VTDEYTSLTAREREIVLLVKSGRTNKAIANELHLSERHRENSSPQRLYKNRRKKPTGR
jgi:FixJ family two-component response regulator